MKYKLNDAEIADLNNNCLRANISAITEISVQNLRTENATEDILKFILGLDLVVADVEFTIQLIMALANSLRYDINQEDFESLGKDIANIKPEV